MLTNYTRLWIWSSPFLKLPVASFSRSHKIGSSMQVTLLNSKDFDRYLLRFSSWAVLFSSFLLFVPQLPSQGPFLMPIITIFLSWDLSHSPYMPPNPYAIPCITAGQGIFFASLFLVMDAYSSSRFSRISCILLLLIFFSIIFHDFLLLLSGMFSLVPQYSFTYSAGLCLSI